MQFQGNLYKKKKIPKNQTPLWRCGTGPSVVWTRFRQQPHQNGWRHLLGGWQFVRWWWEPWIHCWVPEPADRIGPDDQGNPLMTRRSGKIWPSCRSYDKPPPLSSCPVSGRCNSRDVGGWPARKQRGTRPERRHTPWLVPSGLLGRSSQSSGRFSTEAVAEAL